MLLVPTRDVPSQTLAVNLGGQSCTVNVYQLDTAGADSLGNLTPAGLYLDLLVAGAAVITGVICQNMNRIVRDAYLGFVGDLFWYDTQGASDPSSPGLGSRYQLLYLSPTDLAGRG